MTGNTLSVNFPTTPGAFDTTHLPSDVFDGFATKLDSTGSALSYSTFLSGASDFAQAIAVDAFGNVYLTGQVSSGFPTTSGAYDATYNGGGDACLMVLNAAGTALLYSTYLGGSNVDIGWGIALDSTSKVYIAGTTESSNFPTSPNALKRRNRFGTIDGFVTKFAQT